MPESIFWENSPFLELDCGTISVVSDLREYKKDVDYKKVVLEKELYDSYQINLEKLSLSINYPVAVKIINKQNFI